MNIYCSSNEPIIIELNQSINSVDEIIIDLISYSNGERIIRTWKKNDVIIRDQYIIIPLTQAETAKFRVGPAQIRMKWLNNRGFVIFSESFDLTIRHYPDKRVIKDDAPIDYLNMPLSDFIQASSVFSSSKIKTNIAAVDYDEALTNIEIDDIINWEEEYG